MTTTGDGQHLAADKADAAPDPAWITASVRPAGELGRRDVGRLRALLGALSACASIVVLDLAATRLCSPRAAAAIDDAARRLEDHGGCLLCINADVDACAILSGGHAVVLPPATPVPPAPPCPPRPQPEHPDRPPDVP